MTFNTRFTTLAVQAFTIAMLASKAIAGCGDVTSLQAFPFASSQSVTLALHASAVVNPAERSGNALNNTVNPVGMWNFQFLSQGNPPIPDGAAIDFGYVQWHSDGTEIMNSGGHAANTGNFCMGVWVRTGMFTYEVNHFALSYDGTSGALVNKINIREQVTLDPSGNQYTGTFTIDVYNATATQMVDHVAGTIAATRVTVDQMTP